MSETLLSVQGQLVGIPVEEYTGVSGIIVDPVNKTIRLDETVLWDGTDDGSSVMNFNESINKFEYLKFVFTTNDNKPNVQLIRVADIVNEIILRGVQVDTNSASIYLKYTRYSIASTSMQYYRGVQIMIGAATANSVVNYIVIKKVIGVNRIANN